MASDDEPPAGPMLADSGLRCQFVNHLRITLSLSEVRFDLSRLGFGIDDPAPVWRFATAPDHFLTMQRGFAVAADSYYARYGATRAVRFDPASVRFDDGLPRG